MHTEVPALARRMKMTIPLEVLSSILKNFSSNNLHPRNTWIRPTPYLKSWNRFAIMLTVKYNPRIDMRHMIVAV